MAARKATIPIGTSLQTVAPSARNRRVIILSNVGTGLIYVNQEDTTSVAESFPLGPGDKLQTSDTNAIYAMTGTGASVLGVWDDCG